MTYNDEFYAKWGLEEEIENLSCIIKVLTNTDLKYEGFLYSDKFPAKYDSRAEKKVSNPYLDVNKFNREWITPKQILSDLQGWKNQEIILEQQRTAGEFACQQCFKYSTKNTKIGEWYLPAVGELAIMFAKFNTLNKAGSFLNPNRSYWSST